VPCAFLVSHIYPLGVAIIPILFKDKEHDFTIDSEIYVCNKNISKNTILLGYDWLVGGSVLDEGLQIYSIKLVHEFEWGGGVETYISIGGLGSDSEQKLYKKIKTYDENFYNILMSHFEQQPSNRPGMAN